VTRLSDVAATGWGAVARRAEDLVTDDHLLAELESIVAGLQPQRDRASRVR
jgi:hypothetical protein